MCNASVTLVHFQVVLKPLISLPYSLFILSPYSRRLESKRIKRKPNTQKNVKKYSVLTSNSRISKSITQKKAHHIVMSCKLDLYMRSQSDLYLSE